MVGTRDFIEVEDVIDSLQSQCFVRYTLGEGVGVGEILCDGNVTAGIRVVCFSEGVLQCGEVSGLSLVF